MLNKYYAVSSRENLASYLKVYLPLIIKVAARFQINLLDKNIHADHLGMQAISEEEFDETSKALSLYSTLIHNNIIHERRNRVYQFSKPFLINKISIPRIEIFEPKPNAELDNLKPGIEHIAFKVDDYDSFVSSFKKHKLPINREAEYQKGSKFIKTQLIDLVEIEFRNDFLGVK